MCFRLLPDNSFCQKGKQVEIITKMIFELCYIEAIFLNTVVTKNPQKKKFLKGWLHRINHFAYGGLMFAAYQNCTDFKWSTNLFKPFWIMSNCLSDADAIPCLYLRIKEGLSPTKRANSETLINGKARKNAVKS